MTGKKPKHYVNNKDFFKAIVEYQKVCRKYKRKKEAYPQIPNYIGLCIDMICNKLSLKFNFIRYSYIDEMRGDAVENCCAAVDNYDPKRSNNPFSYFTTIAWNAFIRRIDKETTQNYTKHKNLENMMVLSDEYYEELGTSPYAASGGRAEGMMTGGPTSTDNEGLQRHYDVIRNFEARAARKKEKNRQSSLNKLKSKKKTNRA